MPNSSSTTGNHLGRVIGADSLNATDPNLRYRNEAHVIGSVERSARGNTILRVGTQQADTDTWEGGRAHIALTPAERDELIEALRAQQREDNGL